MRTTSVLLVTSGDAEGSQTERALRRRIEARGDLELRTMSRLATLAAADGAGEDGDDEAAMAAQRHIAAADDAFSRFDYGGATTQLGEALELLRPGATRATGRQALAEVHLELAMVLHVHGEREAALESVRTCLHLDAECSADPARHPPELVALIDEARSAADQSAALQVETNPPGALLRLDAGDESEAPYTWEGLSPGQHYLSIERDGFRPEVHVVSVAAGAPTTRRFDLTLGDASARAAAAMRELSERGADADVRWRSEAADLSEADVLIVARLEAAQLSLGAFDGRGAQLGELFAGAEGGGAAQAFLDSRLPAASVPFYGQWWFWTPIAVGVALLLAGGTFLLVNVPSVRLTGGIVIRE